MAHTTTNQYTFTPEVALAIQGDDHVRVLLGATRLVLSAREAEILGLQLLQQAKVARGTNPAIQHGNADIFDPAGAAQVAA